MDWTFTLIFTEELEFFITISGFQLRINRVGGGGGRAGHRDFFRVSGISISEPS